MDVSHQRSPISSFKVAASAGILRQLLPSEEFGRRWLPACANFHLPHSPHAGMSHSHSKQQRRRTAMHHTTSAITYFATLRFVCLLLLLPSSPLDGSRRCETRRDLVADLPLACVEIERSKRSCECNFLPLAKCGFTVPGITPATL